MFFDLARSLRSLTRSPVHWALHEAHRMARRHLENGGNVTPQNTIRDQDFVLPPDVSASAVGSAIEDRLRGQRFSSRKRGIDAVPPLQRLHRRKIFEREGPLLGPHTSTGHWQRCLCQHLQYS